VAKLASSIDTQGKEFRANAAAMRALVQQLEAKRADEDAVVVREPVVPDGLPRVLAEHLKPKHQI